MSATARRIEWTAEQRAEELVGRRDELLRRLPREVRAARALRPDTCELIVDDAIEFASLHHDQHVPTARDLEVVFWSACITRVRRAHEGRYELVRGRFTSAGADALDSIPTNDDPAAQLQADQERALAHEFAATLDPREQRVLRAKYDAEGAAPAGYKIVARRLGLSVGAVRSAERSIERKIEQFAAVYTAGRLCDFREAAISALAQGTADDRQAELARIHINHCAHCRPLFARQLRELASTAFERKVAALLPAVELQERGRVRGAWDAVVDTALRPFSHEGASTAMQLAGSGVGRGAGTIAMFKIVGACMASAGAIGVCATTLVPVLQSADEPSKRATRSATQGGEGVGTHDRLPTRGELHLTPTPTPAPTRSDPKPGRLPATQGGSGPRDHERTPASPAPANAAPGGESEFDPTYQPDSPPQPAPVPAAPGSGEFF